jgi:hypothetical protein
MSQVRSLFLALLLLLGACSMRSAIDALSSPEDRAFAQDFVAKMRSGDFDSLQPKFEPRVWEESQPHLARVPSFYPATPGDTELIGYHVQTNTANGVTSGVKDYTLVTHDGSHWTTTVIRTQSNENGPHLVVGWNVSGSPEMPPAYRQFQSTEAAIPWIQGGAIFGLLLGVGVAVWLVRRGRRKRAAGQGRGTP